MSAAQLALFNEKHERRSTRAREKWAPLFIAAHSLSKIHTQKAIVGVKKAFYFIFLPFYIISSEVGHFQYQI